MHKSLMIASTLALSLGVASAQTSTDTTTQTTQTPATTAPAQTTPATTAPATTSAATTTQVPTFSDVPAGHWAKDAVDLITQRGLIQGFPDGTFRGNQNLTRYEAALIFYRLLQAGTLSSGSLSQSDLATITRGMQEVSTELAAISTRVTDLERLSAEQQARITALETRIAALGTGTGTATAGTDTAALTARIDALEAAVRNIPAGPAGPAADTSALEARIAALEQRAATGTTTTGTTTTGTTTTDTTTGTTTTTDTTATGTTTTTPDTGTTVVIGDTTPATDGATRGNLFAGVSVSASSGTCFIPNAGGRQVNFCTSFGGMVGSTQIIGPFGARVSADYKPAFNALSADVAATYNLNTGSNIQPYVGVGLGLTSSTSRATGNTNTTDTFVKGVIGADFQITNSLAAFAEVDGKYYLSNKGAGALQNSTDPAARGFVPAIKAGLKFYF
ncbi:S-layer homology domain-containing protein [Deinococcus apachensis]|uniref:S-layer homology domain-containing protein n=1 Tax=Deinococcus apachensis TaxID=309886 RepID=UPI0003773980|nr:S-layer homology domain-containing protein [Deinococcus apachensis]